MSSYDNRYYKKKLASLTNECIVTIVFINIEVDKKHTGTFGLTATVETELEVTQSALDVHMGCTPFVKD